MDFYSHQRSARRQSRALVWAFLIAVAAVVCAVDLVLFTMLASAEAEQPALSPIDYAIRHPGAAVACTLFVLGVICLSSLFKSLQLRSGGGVVARALGGSRVEQDTRDPKRRRLRNVVEEMAIASGVPVPEIYVLEHESAINAFAAGHSPANAAVSVTQGALDNLNRDQLQGVIAHEFSHVVNGDMRLNVQLMGWLFGLFVVALIGRTILRVAPRGGKKGGGALLVAALAVMILGYVGLLAGRILQAAVSRQRERLADASAVQFTRDPGGLKNALLKIAGLGEGSRLNAPAAEQAAHMLFAPGVKHLFATHPALGDRIRFLDPSFDVRTLKRAAAQVMQEPPDLDSSFQSEAVVSHLHPGVPIGASVAADPAGIASQVGQLDKVHIAHAHTLRLALPQGLRELAASADHARAMVLALLLSREEAVRNKQLARLATALDPVAVRLIQACAPLIRQLAPMLRLPALLQVFPDLRRLPPRDRLTLCGLADDLINADSRIEVFEFCLARLLETLLQDELQARAPHGRLTLRDSQRELQLLFSTLAHAGATDEDQARRAYEAGFQAFRFATPPDYALDEGWARRLGAALKRLDQLQALEKRPVIEGLVATVAHDSMLNVSEAELLRTVCAILHCPMPPLLPAVT